LSTGKFGSLDNKKKSMASILKDSTPKKFAINDDLNLDYGESFGLNTLQGFSKNNIKIKPAKLSTLQTSRSIDSNSQDESPMSILA